MCGHWIGSSVQMTTCAYYMWKRRAKKAEKEVELLRTELSECRDDLFNEYPERAQGECEVAFDAETARILKGE